MSDKIQQAMEAKAAAEQALALANQQVKDAALEIYREALAALRSAGLTVDGRKPRPVNVTPEMRRAKAAEAGRESWRKKTPEQRAAWVAAINRARRNRATSQGVQ